eukprot:scaffold2170_cov350-Prasinococcus_capsulatus_cf.AAC.2
MPVRHKGKSRGGQRGVVCPRVWRRGCLLLNSHREGPPAASFVENKESLDSTADSRTWRCVHLRPRRPRSPTDT